MFFPIFLLAIIASIEAKAQNDSIVTNATIITTRTYNISSVVPANISKDGKTYYFKYNTNNNQFRIYNRVNVNGEFVKNASEPSMKRKSIRKVEKSAMNELRKFEAFLDEEWNYSSSQNMNRTELPVQIHPFLYNSIFQRASKKTNNAGEKVADVTKIVFNRKKNNSMILNFNLGKMEANHSIDNAELHFYWSVAENSDFHKNSCVLRLYEVEKKNNDTYAEKNPDTHKLLNVIYASKAQTGWQMFRISRKSIDNWVNMTEELRLLISLSQANQVNSTTVFDDTKNEAKWRTFLILKIRNEEIGEDNIEVAPLTNSTGLHTVPHSYCSRKDFYIDFRKLHWSNFVIAPEGFMAYNCNGKCTRHNADSFSNHLKMLTTFQDVGKKNWSPCCVPTKYYALPIMFYDKFGNVIIKIYKDLIAASCGCR